MWTGTGADRGTGSRRRCRHQAGSRGHHIIAPWRRITSGVFRTFRGLSPFWGLDALLPFQFTHILDLCETRDGALIFLHLLLFHAVLAALIKNVKITLEGRQLPRGFDLKAPDVPSCLLTPAIISSKHSPDSSSTKQVFPTRKKNKKG